MRSFEHGRNEGQFESGILRSSKRAVQSQEQARRSIAKGGEMLDLGLASSHAPMMFQAKEFWPRILERLRSEVRDSLPHNARLELKVPGIIETHIERINHAFAALRDQVQSYRPDALILIGDDQGDMFDDANNPTFAIYTGADPIWGRSARDPLSLPLEDRQKISFPV